MPRITPSSCLLPTGSLLCAHLNFPDAFSSLIKHFHRFSLLAGSDFFFPCSHGNASPGQAVLEPVTNPMCGYFVWAWKLPCHLGKLGKRKSRNELVSGKGSQGEKCFLG